jgi:16S rRNA (guanine(966)-N(2))-methyltransferase RsmD
MPGGARSRGTSAGRVIAGTARGVRLGAPGEGTRPLADRVKQALFAILEPEIRGRPFLDLFAGSGAAGIEALSRGAVAAVFVERDAGALRAIVANLAAAGLAPAARTVRSDAVSWLVREGQAAGPFAVIFIDPPYDRPELVERSLEAVAAAGPDAILGRDGVVVVKRFWKERSVPSPLLRSVREERFGETMLSFYRWADEVEA